jgi:hypothetical protein
MKNLEKLYLVEYVQGLGIPIVELKKCGGAYKRYLVGLKEKDPTRHVPEIILSPVWT